MKAMILAAGLGTRLRPLTNERPKALVEVAGRTLLEIALSRLRDLGIRDVIINTHHFADQVAAYLQSNQNFGMCIELSQEEELLDTGGGLKKAAYFFRSDRGPLLLRNVDVISNIDLSRMVDLHQSRSALATLAVQDRATSRYLLFNERDELCGRKFAKDSSVEMARNCPNPRALAFCGIHVISPKLLNMLTETGAFSIINSYLRLAAKGEKVLSFPADEYYWRDLGTPESVAKAEDDARNGRVALA